MRKTKHYTDEELISHMRNGEAYAFKELFHRYYQELCGFAYYLVRDRSEAEEIVQDLFARLWEKRADLTIKSCVKGYLFISCKNLSLNSLHRSSNHQQQPLRNENELKEASLSQNPEHIFYFENLYKDFLKAVEQLPAQAKKVFVLRYFEKTKQKEVARLLKISENTVEKHMSRALKTLRKKLAIYHMK